LSAGSKELAFGLKVREFIFEFNGEFRDFCKGFVKNFWQMYAVQGDSQESGCLW
jgi:hypothetical protein